MTDLLQLLPDFPTDKHSRLLPSLEKHHITTSHLLTLDAFDLAKRVRVPPRELRELADAVLVELHGQFAFKDDGQKHDGQKAGTLLASPLQSLSSSWRTISTLDDGLDAALGGGVPAGYVTEITGESGAGKTQFLLTLLLSAQLPSPHGLSKSALYISTESALATNRLSQLLETHPHLSALPDETKPSLSRILSIQTPDLESQEHIIRYQLPVAIQRHTVGLLVIDSIAANYRAEFERSESRNNDNGKAHGKAMAERREQLIQLGSLLRNLARTSNIAVVVANQVADRFSPTTTAPSGAASRNPSDKTDNGFATWKDNNNNNIISQENGTPSRHSTPSIASQPPLASPDPLTLDHQQRWFTGWGDVSPRQKNLKTPSLGLVWANQIACRVALLKQPIYSGSLVRERPDGDVEVVKWRRWMKVVYAPWVGATEGRGVEFEILGSGVRAVRGKQEGKGA